MSQEDLRKITDTIRWSEVVESVVIHRKSIPATPDEFGTYWIEAGHRIREQANDDPLLTKLLRLLLPQYQGESITLYRGENLVRWQSGSVGFAWSQNIETAEMFGRGLNSLMGGGLLLQGFFRPEAIISGPNGHSEYLGEHQFTVDPSLGEDIKVLKTYPPQ